jgi:hypothetical protein
MDPTPRRQANWYRTVRSVAAFSRSRLNLARRIWPEGMTAPPYPWSGLTDIPPQDYSIANIGQLKYLFSFDLE